MLLCFEVLVSITIKKPDKASLSADSWYNFYGFERKAKFCLEGGKGVSFSKLKNQHMSSDFSRERELLADDPTQDYTKGLISKDEDEVVTEKDDDKLVEYISSSWSPDGSLGPEHSRDMVQAGKSLFKSKLFYSKSVCWTFLTYGSDIIECT